MKGMMYMTTKPKKTLRVSALLLIVCLISTVMLSGTFAKYTSEYSGQDTALVARWSFAAEDGDDNVLGATGESKELKLFDHLYDTYINKTDGVADPNTKFIIAPGVGDEFTLKMDYIADVAADVLITIDDLAGSAVVPVEYSADGGLNWVNRANLAEALANKIITSGKGTEVPTVPAGGVDGTFRIAAVANDSKAPVAISETVKWRWAYDAAAQVGKGVVGIASSDTVDTPLGEASQLAAKDDITQRTTYGIKITLEATQVMPEIS